MTQFREDSQGAVIVDDRYAPLLVSTFIGEVALPLGQWFERTVTAIIQKEYARGHRLINIHDTTLITRTPPEMRKFWAEMSARNEAVWQSRTLESALVISNPIMRGVMTAVGWLNPKVAQLPTYPTIDRAISESIVKLERAGMHVSPAPSSLYRVPSEVAHLFPSRAAKKG